MLLLLKAVLLGVYYIYCAGLSSSTILSATNAGPFYPAIISARYIGPGEVTIYIYNVQIEDSWDDDFSFVFYNP